MNLSILERMLMANILPKSGSVFQVRLVNDLINKLVPNAMEQEDIEFSEESQPDGSISTKWNPQKEIKRDFTFTQNESDLIRKELKKLDKDEKITGQHLSIWDKFIDN